MAPLKTIERFFAFRVPLADCGSSINDKPKEPIEDNDMAVKEMRKAVSMRKADKYNSDKKNDAHLNRDRIKSNLSVLGIQGHQENAPYKSFETRAPS